MIATIIALTAMTNPVRSDYVYKYPQALDRSSYRVELKKILKEEDMNMTSAQLTAMVNLVDAESDFRPWLYNGGKPYKRKGCSSAFGLYQCLESTYRNHGYGKSYGIPDIKIQTMMALKYIKSRYSSPENAWSFWKRHRWY